VEEEVKVLKLAVKVSNLVTLIIASESTDFSILIKFHIPKKIARNSIEFTNKSKIVVEVGEGEIVINWVELSFRFSSQLRNSKPLFGFAMHLVPDSIKKYCETGDFNPFSPHSI
jgi:hypothetical protein